MSKREQIVGLIVGIIGALMLAVGTASLANVGARGVNIVFLILGVVWFAFGVRAVQRKDRRYFFTKHGLAVFGFVICTCLSLYFLFAGEDSPFDYTTPGAGGQSRIFRERGVSAYTYYFAWHKSQREAVSKGEDGGYALYLIMHGCDSDIAKEVALDHNPRGITMVGFGERPATLSELTGRNMAVAALGLLGALAFAVFPLSRRFMSKTVPSTVLEPTAAAPSVPDEQSSPKVGGESPSVSGGAGREGAVLEK